MNHELNVLMDSRKLSVYSAPNSNDKYVEGRAGKSYKLQLKNNTSYRAEYVVSVDGLDITTGKPAGSESKGYIVAAHSTVTVEGWLVDNSTAAKFTFGDKKSSYSEAKGEGTDNVGVIGLQVFTEKRPDYKPRDIVYLDRYIPYHTWPRPYDKFWDVYPYYSTLTASSAAQSDSISSIGSAVNMQLCSMAVGSNASSPQAVSNNMRSLYAKSTSVGPDISAFEHPEEVTTSLGTEFGEATNFSTTTVDFERASNTPAFTQVLYYGDSKDLNALGITMNWQKSKAKAKPQPFPADTNYCEPPAGWGRINT